MVGKISCAKCRKKCRGNVLKISEKYFHKDCFKCSKCSKSLEDGGFFMKDDQFYCEDDYQRFFVSKCKVCSKDLLGEVVTVMNFSFHRECFHCSSCNVNFNPGDRVTVWHERFYCPRCISNRHLTLSLPSPSPSSGQQSSLLIPTANGHRSSTNPLDDVEDEGCISAACDTSSSAAPSNAKKNHSILRKSRQKDRSQLLDRRQNESLSGSIDRVHMSTDSGLGDKTLELRTLDSQITPNGIVHNYASRPTKHASLWRVPNSDYGRYLNQSYMHLTNGHHDTMPVQLPPPPPVQKPSQYRRHFSFSNLVGYSRPKHFHVPEGNKSRFLPPSVKAHSIIFGQTPSPAVSNSELLSPPRTSTPGHRSASSALTQSAHELRRPNGHHHPSSTTATLSPGVESGVTDEVRRLSSFPAGQQPDPAHLPAIERLDWPAPPSYSVLLAEMNRERRRRRKRDQSRNGGDMDDGGQSQDDEQLSIDCSLDEEAHSFATDHGIGEAIKREESELAARQKQHHRSRSQHLLDPVSASRSPNAAIEPAYKTRSATQHLSWPSRVSKRLRPAFQHPITHPIEFIHLGSRTLTLSQPQESIYYRSNDSPTDIDSGHTLATPSPASRTLPVNQFSRPLRPGYTGGLLTVSSPSRPASAAYESSNGLSPYPSTPVRGDDTLSYQGSNNNSTRLHRPCNGRVVGHSNGTLNGGYQNGNHSTSSRLSLSSISPTNRMPSTDRPSSLLCHSTSPRMDPVLCQPPKIISYDQLKDFVSKPSKEVDRVALESHLSENEFNQVFQLSRSAFYRLPEWKRNDLKRRVHLF